jgi:EAL domain-containing protein (putative c-di-GMP-specific phosphodiesterase class I)
LTVVAEGVETQVQLIALEEMGCERAQGYLLGRPCTADVLEDVFTGAHRRATGSVAARSVTSASSS